MNSAYAHDTMEINGLKCRVHAPVAPKGAGVHRLPPPHPVRSHKVEEFPACPANWMHGSGKATSHFFPIDIGRHMWLDFNMNVRHAHHVAIVLSIQGINPITGQPSKTLQLEQYTSCPLHGEFKEDRFCLECGHKWPAQNYLTTTSCPAGQFWIDGFYSHGKVLGFLITEDTRRSIAAQIIGDDRVFAIGVGFFLSKEEKPALSPSPLRSMAMGWTAQNGVADSYETTGVDYDFTSCDSKGMLSSEPKVSCSMSQPKRRGGPCGQSAGAESRSIDVQRAEIAAGAEINQELSFPDPESRDFYQDEPIGVIYGNYCFPNDFSRILSAGRVEIGDKLGFMKDLNVGNP